MARPESGGKPHTDDAERDAYSISEFCRRHGFSVQAFYKFKSTMPATFKIGTRVLISREAAEAWRRNKEAAA